VRKERRTAVGYVGDQSNTKVPNIDVPESRYPGVVHTENARSLLLQVTLCRLEDNGDSDRENDEPEEEEQGVNE